VKGGGFMYEDFICNEEYFNLLVTKYTDMVLRLAFTYLKNMSDAQDLCQEVFLRLYKHQATFKDKDHEKAWIIRVTINACKDVMRSQWKKRFFLDDEIIVPIENEENKEIVSLVLELPIKYRSVIYLYYFENYSTVEVANILGRNEATIRTQLKRARELIKSKMIGGPEYD
jgi:RNA polymerase sigma-70 factor (ECF subfamily)